MNNTANRYSKDKKVKEQTINTWKDNRAQGTLSRFIPTANQSKIVDSINTNTMTVVDAPSGSGKTSVVLHTFCKAYMANKEYNILVIRQPNEAGNLDKLGALPGELGEKTAPYFQAYKEILTDFLGAKFQADFDKRIKFEPINYMLGRTLDNALILVDEAQTVEPMLMKLMLERVGYNSRIVIVGDKSQTYSGGRRGGLQDVMGRFFKEDGTPEIEDAQYIKLTSEDVMRSEFCKSVVKLYDRKPL